MDGGTLPLSAAFGLHFHTDAHGDRPQGPLLLAAEAAASASGGPLRVHRVEAAAASTSADDEPDTLQSSRRAWLEAESVEAIVGAAPPARLDRGTWVAVPCAHIARFLLPVIADDASYTGVDGRYLLWNPATDALLLPRPGPSGDRPSSMEVVGVAPASAAAAAAAASANGGGGWEWRRASSDDGEAGRGRLVWRVEDGAAWHLVLAVEDGATGGGGSEWRLVLQQEEEEKEEEEEKKGEKQQQQQEQLATELICRRREWMGTRL